MTKPVNEMFETRMSRKQFLANAGTTLITLVGISAVVKGFGLREEKGSGYGSSTYGGSRTTRK